MVEKSLKIVLTMVSDGGQILTRFDIGFIERVDRSLIKLTLVTDG